MATISPASTATAPADVRRDPERATRRVMRYFHSLGLPDEHARRNAEQIVRRVQGELHESEHDLASAAVDHAMETVAQWLDEIAESASSRSSAMRSQLLWHLRPVLNKHPEMFLRSEGLPDEVRPALQMASRAMLPPAAPRAMPPQRFGDLPRLWYKLAAYGSLFWARLTQTWRPR